MKTFALINNLYIKPNAIRTIIAGHNILAGCIDAIDFSLDDFKNSNDKVLIEKKAFSCNYREIALISKYFAKMRNEGIPYMGFGSEFVGIVVDIGKNVNDLKIGDKVIPLCSYSKESSYKGVPSNQASLRRYAFYASQLIKISDEIPDEIAASFPVAACTVYGMIRRLSLKDGENILITDRKSVV